MAEPVSVDLTSLHGGVRKIVAVAAEQAIMPRYRQLQSHEIREKAVGELVTIADQDSERLLSAGLAELLPDAEIVGEEAAEADPSILDWLSGPLTWIVDPLDGTGNFGARDGPFGIIVALASHGEPIGGWLYDPRSGRFCSAVRGEGAAIDGRPVKTHPSEGRLPTAGISSLLSGAPGGSDLVRRLAPAFATEPIPRCAAEQYPRMVVGDVDVTLYERTLPWDHAAGVLWLTEAGGRATRFDGSPYRVDDGRSGLLAAATPQLWKAAMTRLAVDCQ